MFTSPVQPPIRRTNTNARGNRAPRHDESDGHTSEDGFEQAMPRSAKPIKRKPRTLGPPITSDAMTGLSDLQQICVDAFVEKAMKKDEKIRNIKNLRKALFTMSEYRQMAIHWTTSKEEMVDLGLNEEKVNLWGDRFIPLIIDAQKNYEIMVHDNTDMDVNHQNVIDLVSDEDGEDDEYPGGTNEDDDDNISVTEEPSKYFATNNVVAFNQSLAQAQSLPQSYQPKPASQIKPSRGGYASRGKFKGGKKSYNRRSTGSNSGKGESSRSGVSKKGQARKTSAGSRKATTSRGGGAANGNLMARFANRGGGGIGAMPT
jgi:bloom syndrome protein